MIELLHDYRGRLTGQELIRKGAYAVDDLRLFGLADYLVANGHARVIAPPRINTADTAVETQEDTLVDDSGAFEEIPNTRAVKRKGK